MSSFTKTAPVPETGPMPKKRQPADDQPTSGRPINFRASADLADRLDRIAAGLGLDVSNLVRMVLYENLDPYEERVELRRKRRPKTDD